MMLHGFAGWADNLRSTFALGEVFGVVIIAPESRGLTWGRSVPGFDGDVRYLGAAYRHVTGIIDIDESHVALAGQSDGAGYALSMGLAYGDVFNHLMIFAGGMMSPLRKRGRPRIFFAHGRDDNQMPIDRTARRFVPQLKAEGYDVTLREYDGGHGVPREVVREAYQWFVADFKRS
jgi:poly(3-hydroxybutyrate) depolymerase